MKDYPEDIHWRMIVSNLKRKGWTYQKIAKETGFSVKNLSEMESETYYPPYLSIIKLLDLHVSECPDRHLRVGVMSPEEGG